ncbi:MAG: hypothetical protein N3F64_03015 [Nitrososphaeria archaeon]|nr:hypothetical protein [Nitrososphaeria archaeon]
MDKMQIKLTKNIIKEYKELYNTLGMAKNTINSREMKKNFQKVSNKNKTNIGNKITSVGIALIAFPDPTISDIIGSALILSGQYIQRRSPIGIEDVYKQFNKISSSLKIF